MTSTIFTCPDWLDVSRETFERLQSFVALVEKWNPAINLISKSGIPLLWQRHVLDSAQLFDFASQNTKTWCDLGSGGGFPGIVIAILAQEKLPELRLTLVESDRRKSVFLTEAARQLGLNLAVATCRIEDLAPQAADIVSARALAPLDVLCGYAARHLNALGTAIFPKGAAAADEIRDAKKSWVFDLTEMRSRTDANAAVLVLKGLRHV